VPEDAMEEYIIAREAARHFTSKAVSFGGNVYSNLNKGNAQLYYNFSTAGASSEDEEQLLKIVESLEGIVINVMSAATPASATDNEIAAILLTALNRDTETIKAVIASARPIPAEENRCYLVFTIQPIKGASHQRRCYLTEGELTRILALMQEHNKAVLNTLSER